MRALNARRAHARSRYTYASALVPVQKSATCSGHIVRRAAHAHYMRASVWFCCTLPGVCTLRPAPPRKTRTLRRYTAGYTRSGISYVCVFAMPTRRPVTLWYPTHLDGAPGFPVGCPLTRRSLETHMRNEMTTVQRTAVRAHLKRRGVDASDMDDTALLTALAAADRADEARRGSRHAAARAYFRTVEAIPGAVRAALADMPVGARTTSLEVCQRAEIDPSMSRLVARAIRASGWTLRSVRTGATVSKVWVLLPEPTGAAVAACVSSAHVTNLVTSRPRTDDSGQPHMPESVTSPVVASAPTGEETPG